MDIKEKLEQIILDEGISEVGFSCVEETPYKGLTTAISVVVRLLDAVVDEIDDAPTKDYFHHYRTVNAYIDRVLLKVSMFLQSEGYRAAPIPASQSVSEYAGLFPHKGAAVAAGLGWIGKSDLFISYQEGGRVRLGTVLTDAPIEVEEHPYVGMCGECNICTSLCPAMAIRGVNYSPGMKREELYDAAACSSYMKQKFQSIGRGAVCGICMSHCPKRSK